MKKLNLIITIDEGKLMMGALSELPFKLVFELIGEINRQSNMQHTESSSAEIEFFLKLTSMEVKLISEALSHQPYNMVRKIMDKINSLQTVQIPTIGT